MINLDSFPEYSRSYVKRWIEKQNKQGLPLLNEDINGVRDWLFSLPEDNPKMVNKLQKLNWPMAIEHQKKWHSLINKKSQKSQIFDGDPDAIKIIKILPNGFKWVEILTSEGKDYEGNAMGHCVGRGAYDDKIIYSLRDTNNLPHCTIEYDKNKHSIPQIQGKANQVIIDKYHKDVFDFITETLNVKKQNILGLNKIGYVLASIDDKPEDIIRIIDFFHILQKTDNYRLFNSYPIFDSIDLSSLESITNTYKFDFYLEDSSLGKHVVCDNYSSFYIKNIDNIETLSLKRCHSAISVNSISVRNCQSIKEIDLYPNDMPYRNLTFEENPLLTKLTIHSPAQAEMLYLDGNIDIKGKLTTEGAHLQKCKKNILDFISARKLYVFADIMDLLLKTQTYEVVNISKCYNLTIDDNAVFNDSLTIQQSSIQHIGDNITVSSLYLRGIENDFTIGENLISDNIIDASYSNLKEIGSGLQASYLNIIETPIKRLENISIDKILIATDCMNLTEVSGLTIKETAKMNFSGCHSLVSIPDNISLCALSVEDCFSLEKIPDNLSIEALLADNCLSLSETGHNLNAVNARFENCHEITKISSNSYIQNTLSMKDCSSLQSIGENVKTKVLNLTNCMALKSLPNDLEAEIIILPDGQESSLEDAHSWFKEKYPKIKAKILDI